MIFAHICRTIEKEIWPERPRGSSSSPVFTPIPIYTILQDLGDNRHHFLLAKVLGFHLKLAHSDLGLWGRKRVVNIGERAKKWEPFL